MRNTLGSITATVSVRIGDGDPADILTIDIPITVAPALHGADIVVDRNQVNHNLADGLRAVADQLAPDSRKQHIELNVHPAPKPEAVANAAAEQINFELRRGGI